MRQNIGFLLTPDNKGILQMMTEELNVANQSILESCPSDIIRINEEDVIVQISSGLCTLLGIDESHIINVPQISRPPLISQLINSTTSVEIKTEDNTLYHFSHTFFDNNDDHSRTHIFTNISTVLGLYGENQRLKEEARQLQLIDADTSLLTHRALLLVLESQISQCRRYETSLSVIKLNLDFDCDVSDFKLKLLKITHLLKDQLRWSDMISRSDKKQFTIILPETDECSSISLINKIQNNINQWEGSHPVSFGFSSWNKNMSSSDLLDACEQSLLQKDNKYNNGQDVA